MNNINKPFWITCLALSLLGLTQTSLMLETRKIDLDMTEFNQSGELRVAWMDYYSDGWKLVQLIWIFASVLSFSNLLYKWLYVVRVINETPLPDDVVIPDELSIDTLNLSHDNSTSNQENPTNSNHENNPVSVSNTAPNPDSHHESGNGVTNPVIAPLARVYAMPKSNADAELIQDLITDPVLMFVSPQKGSGKTSRAAGNIANHLRAGHICKAILPIGSNHEYKGIHVYGRKSTENEKWSDIAHGIYEFVEEAKRRNSLNSSPDHPEYSPFDEAHIHLFCDEMSGFDQKIDPQLIIDLWDVNIRVLRQCNMSFGVGSHGMTKAMLGGDTALSGLISGILEGSTQLLLEGIKDPNVNGGTKPGDWFTHIPIGIHPNNSDHPMVKKRKFPNGFFAPSSYYTTTSGMQVRYSDFTSVIIENMPSDIQAMISV